MQKKWRYLDFLFVYKWFDFYKKQSKLEDFKKAMTKESEMIDIWLMAYYLGIGMKKMEDQIFISQEGYAKEMLGTCWLLKGMGGKCLKMDVDCKRIDLKA